MCCRKSKRDFLGCIGFLNDVEGRNAYIEHIEANIARLQQQLTAAMA